MKRTFAFFAIAFLLLGTVKVVQAEIWEYDAQIYDLSHNTSYAWNFVLSGEESAAIQQAINTNPEQVEVEFKVDGVFNWNDDAHDLFINLLNDVPGAWYSGQIMSYGDYNPYSSNIFEQYENYFNGVELLAQYDEDDFQTTPVDISYTFNGSQLTTLATFLANNTFGIGLDPDCHYYSNGIHMKIITGMSPPPNVDAVPEPGSIFLLGTGMLCLAGWQRRRQPA